MPLGVDYVPTGVYVKGEMRLRTGRCRSLSGDDDLFLRVLSVVACFRRFWWEALKCSGET